MRKLPKHGDIVVHGFAQEMADGTWAARCCVTDNVGHETNEFILEGPAMEDKEQAITDGVHLGIDWVNKKYPTDGN